MPLTPKQKAALNLFSLSQVDLITSEQSGNHRSTLTGEERSIALGDSFDELQDGMAYSAANITLAVSSSGSDTTASRPDLCTGGDYSSTPFLT